MLGLQMELRPTSASTRSSAAEILSAVRSAPPACPRSHASGMAALRTLDQIVEYMRARGAAAAPAATTQAATPAAPSAPAVDLEALMLTIVAEKTGYPVEMLGPSDGAGGRPRHRLHQARRDPLRHARARPRPARGQRQRNGGACTLGQIVDYMRSRGAASAPAAPAAAHAAAPAPAAPSADLEALMLTIVAEKTGYPVEMLGLQMELEADLGIDSIKRVEILSAMRERAPGLPEVNASEMAALRTLGQIVDYMRGRGASAAPAAPAAARARPRPLRRRPPVLRSSASCSSRRPRRRAGSSWRPLGARRVVVTDDGGGVAAAVVRALGERGVPAEVVGAVSGEPDAVLFLGGLREVATVDDAVAVNREAFRAAQAVGALRGERRSLRHRAGHRRRSSAFGPRRAARGRRRSPLARTAAIEWPSAAVKAVDLERAGRGPEALARRALVDELFAGGATREVGLHADGTRTTLRSVAREAAPGEPVIDPAAAVVAAASGGARGDRRLRSSRRRSRRARASSCSASRLDEEPAALPRR